MLVSYAEGDVIGTPGYDVIKELESFVSWETEVSIGSKVERTVDLLSIQSICSRVLEVLF